MNVTISILKKCGPDPIGFVKMEYLAHNWARTNLRKPLWSLALKHRYDPKEEMIQKVIDYTYEHRDIVTGKMVLKYGFVIILIYSMYLFFAIPIIVGVVTGLISRGAFWVSEPMIKLIKQKLFELINERDDNE